MRVLVLGGAGDVGRHLAATTGTSEAIASLFVADLDRTSAEDAAARLGPKAAAVSLGVTDDAALAAAMADCDIVATCVGPYHRFGTKVLSAAGCHYLDVCDDWEPTLEMLALSSDAEATGITAIVGTGGSPGVTNLLASAAHAASTVSIRCTRWGGDLADALDDDDDTSSRATLEHWLLQATGSIRVHRDGAATDVRLLERVVMTFPGTGRIIGHALGHPEPVTLLLTFPALRDSLNLMNMPEAIISALRRCARDLNDGVCTINDTVTCLETRLGENEGAASTWHGLRLGAAITLERLGGTPYAQALAALAIGRRYGKPARAGAWIDGSLPDGTGGSTGRPLSRSPCWRTATSANTA